MTRRTGQRLLALGALLAAAAGSSHRAEAYEAPRAVVYLERGGASLVAGADAAARGRASVLVGQGIDEVDVPAYSRGDAEWNRTVACVRERYARWNIDIVDERPAGDDFTMAVVGGKARLLGFRGDVAGIAPDGVGEVVHGAVAFVFERSIHGGAQAVCETAVHEIGHTLGLDHAYLCEDPMSYLTGCGAKRFQDVDAPCGEMGARRCENGASTQNSVRHLDAALGVRGQEDPYPPPAPPPPPDDQRGDPPCHGDPPQPEPEPEPGYDSDGPALSLLTSVARRRYDSAQPFVVAVRASDASGVARVELGWQQGESGRVFTCDALPDDVPVTCEQHGDVYVFALQVGRGTRRFALRAFDAYGNVSTTRTMSVRFR